MLLKIELENFFSIKDKISIDFRAGKINTNQARELQDNVIEWNGIKVLKSIGLFGPNASGKSNIIKAVSFCCRMILESHNHNEGVTFNFRPFKFDGYADKPSSFLIDFVCENIEYEYSFTLTQNKIIKESLFYYPKNRRAKIFTRDEDVYSFATGVIPAAKDVEASTSNVNLFLSRANNMNRKFAQKLFHYFNSSLKLGLVVFDNQEIETLSNEYHSLVLKALAICDIDIADIKLLHEKVNIAVLDIKNESGSFGFKEADQIRFKTSHKLNPAVSFDMFEEESKGTKRLYIVLLRLLEVVKNGKSLLLDEFDESLHTRLAEIILDLIHASSQSQLLFASHNTNLIDTKRLRKDQIVFVNKKENGSTEIYSLYDFKDFRENMDAEKGYIQGRFDAVPYVESSVSSLKHLLEE